MNTLTPAPIHIDPLLAEIFEILHRMTTSQDQVLGWYAWAAIGKLERYEEKQRVAAASREKLDG